MRRREGGAGCGTRERGKRKPRPRAALGKPPRGTKTAGSVRLAVNAKAVMPRGALGRRGRTRYGRPGSRRSGPAREKRAGLAKSRPCAFSARHSPHFEGKEKETGKPQARANLGPLKLGYLTIEY